MLLPPDIRSDAIPRHIAVIMDGNGRWAKSQGWQRIKGHRAGADAVSRCVEACADLGVEFLTLYAFSTENWQRPKTEVSALMVLLEKFLKERRDQMVRDNVRLQAIGRLTDLPQSCQDELHRVIEATSQNTGVTLILALSYGAREEIVDGIRSLVRNVAAGHLDSAMITPDVFSKHLYTRYYPDPDLLIRTSGEMRLSNFLLWQCSYAEIVILQKLWPDFQKEDLYDSVREYQKRQRRFGAV
ncbi:MAG: isoprenyl transferase [Verrucomicrobiota bacterium]